MAQLHTAGLLNTQDEGVFLDQDDQIETITVNTENTAYEITVLCGKTGDVLVRGGRHFPQNTRSKYLGASVGGSLLKVHAIYVGLSMEFLHEGRRIITSPVRSIAIG